FVVAALYDRVLQPATAGFELEGCRECVEPFGREGLERARPRRRSERGGRLAPVPAVVPVLAGTHDELVAAVFGLAHIDQSAGWKGVLVAGHGGGRTVEAGIGKIEHGFSSIARKLTRPEPRGEPSGGPL